MNAWGTGNEGGSPTRVAEIILNGQHETVEAGGNFRQVINRHARAAGLGKIRVLLDGEELLSEADAPDTIEAGMQITILRDDRGGCR